MESICRPTTQISSRSRMQSVYSDYPDVTREELKPSPLMTEYITQGPEVRGFGDRCGEESGQEVAGDLHTEEQKLCTFFTAKKKKTRLGRMANAWLSREISGPSAETNYLWQVTAFLKAARRLPRSTLLFDLDWFPNSGQCTSPSWSFCYSRSRNMFPAIPSNK